MIIISKVNMVLLAILKITIKIYVYSNSFDAHLFVVN